MIARALVVGAVSVLSLAAAPAFGISVPADAPDVTLGGVLRGSQPELTGTPVAAVTSPFRLVDEAAAGEVTGTLRSEFFASEGAATFLYSFSFDPHLVRRQMGVTFGGWGAGTLDVDYLTDASSASSTIGLRRINGGDTLEVFFPTAAVSPATTASSFAFYVRTSNTGSETDLARQQLLGGRSPIQFVDALVPGGGATVAVPEPASLGLLLTACTALALRQRRSLSTRG